MKHKYCYILTFLIYICIFKPKNMIKGDFIGMEKDKIFNNIQCDIKRIDNQLADRNGSEQLWDELKIKYSMILPDIIKHVKEKSKMDAFLQGYDYRPELKQLKTALLTWILKNEDEITIKNECINNESKDLICKKLPTSTEEVINNLVIESKIYISKNKYSEKIVGVEKLWDAFERLKTIRSTNKKESIENIISHITNNDKELSEMLTKEFNELTNIGNSYSIRHHEINQKKLPNIYYVEYLYFRLLSLVSCVISLMDSETVTGIFDDILK